MADGIDTKLNLSVLQRLDNSITTIIDTASQVALYGFSKENHEWEKTEIEGALFVYTRSKKPQHGFIVINRVSTKNFVEHITNKLDFQIQIPFLLYRNGKGNIYGIWFYEQEQCKKIGRLLRGLSEINVPKQQKSSDKQKTTEKVQKKENNNSVNINNNANNNNNFDKMDIMSLLTRAQEEYDKRSTTQESPASVGKCPQLQQQRGVIVKPTPVRANGVVLANGSSSSVALSIDSLFAQAGEGKHVYKGGDIKAHENLIESQMSRNNLSESKKSLENAEDIIQKLLSNSNANTPDRKEQKSLNPRKITRARSATYSSSTLAAVERVEMDLKERLNISPKCVPVKQIASQVKSELPSHPELILGSPGASKTEAVDIPILTPAMLELSSSVPDSRVASYRKHHSQDSSYHNSYSVSSSLPGVGLESGSPSIAPLLSPMDFKVPAKNISPTNLGESPPEIDESFILHSNHDFDEHDKDLLLPKNLMQTPRGVQKLPNSMGVTPLTKYQLREALTYMLQNDEDFIDRLHDCYLKSLKSQLNGYKLS